MSFTICVTEKCVQQVSISLSLAASSHSLLPVRAHFLPAHFSFLTRGGQNASTCQI